MHLGMTLTESQRVLGDVKKLTHLHGFAKCSQKTKTGLFFPLFYPCSVRGDAGPLRVAMLHYDSRRVSAALERFGAQPRHRVIVA